MSQAPRLLVWLFLAVLPLGCSRPADPPAPKSGPAAAPPAGAASTTAAGNTAPAPAVESVSGPVIETMDAASYTYVRVKTASGDVWAASDRFPVAVGDRVTVPLETPMSNFHSPSLKRDFPLIYFASRIAREGESAPAAAVAPPMALGHSTGGAAQGTGDASSKAAPLTPVAGATPIAKIWAERKALAGKTVTVHGRVVKFNGGILDRNWLHLQDGTGRAADGTNDLLVTTDAAAKVGDVITVSGTVAVDQDFTAGYAYKVMLEKATIK